VYRVQCSGEDGSWHYVTGEHLQDLLCDDEWLTGELNCLTMLGSNMLITLSLGARKKEETLRTRMKDEYWGVACGDKVIVRNHGNYWPHSATVTSIDTVKKVARIKWETTLKFCEISLGDIVKKDDTIGSPSRVRKLPDYFINSDNFGPVRKRPRSENINLETHESVKKKKPSEDIINDSSVSQKIQTKMRSYQHMYSTSNTQKKCAEGAVVNLLIQLHFPPEDVDEFWRLSFLPIDNIMLELGEKQIPNKVQSAAGAVNALEKCIWILRKKFHFSTTTALKPNRFKQVQGSVKIISEFKFPVLISVTATGTQYKHVAVIWDGVILDYEKKMPIEFNLKNFSELCGPTTNFSGIEHGYGLFPDSSIRQKHPECGSWGEIEYKSGNIRKKYFV
jgi:hypothetical protein